MDGPVAASSFYLIGNDPTTDSSARVSGRLPKIIFFLVKNHGSSEEVVFSVFQGKTGDQRVKFSGTVGRDVHIPKIAGMRMREAILRKKPMGRPFRIVMAAGRFAAVGAIAVLMNMKPVFAGRNILKLRVNFHSFCGLFECHLPADGRIRLGAFDDRRSAAGQRPAGLMAGMGARGKDENKKRG